MEVDVNAVKCIARKRFVRKLMDARRLIKHPNHGPDRQIVMSLVEPDGPNLCERRTQNFYARKPKTTNQNTRKGNSPQERKTQKEARQARAEAARHEWGLI
jgi:hypothetical protein